MSHMSQRKQDSDASKRNQRSDEITKLIKKNLTLRPNAGVAQAEEGEINSTLSSFKHRPGAERERVYWGQIRPS